MSRRDVVTFLTSPARSGKSFNEVRRIVDETLPHEQGSVYTNLPLNLERIAEYCAVKHGLNYDDTLSRLHIIPREEEERWKNAGSDVYNAAGNKVGKHENAGPWSYFADKPIANGTIIIDEIHNFCGSIGTPNQIANLWQKWLGELGHNQAVFRCLSQAPEKVHKCIKQEAQAWYVIRNTGLDRDPYFKIEIYDWMELYAGLLGGASYKIFVFEQESKKAEGRREAGTRQMHLMGPPYFAFYNSFNAPISNAQATNVNPFEHEWERHLRKGFIAGRASLVWWFYRKNWQGLTFAAGKMAVLMLIVGGFITGQIPRLIQRAVSSAVTRALVPPAIPKTGDGKPEDPKAAPTVSSKTPAHLTAGTSADAASMTTNANMPAPVYFAPPAAVLKKIANPIVLMTPLSITLKRGQTIKTGQRITSGANSGSRLSEIDWKNRSAQLDTGEVLTFGDN